LFRSAKLVDADRLHPAIGHKAVFDAESAGRLFGTSDPLPPLGRSWQT